MPEVACRGKVADRLIQEDSVRIENGWIKTGALVACVAVALSLYASIRLGDQLADTHRGQSVSFVGQDVPVAVRYFDEFRNALILQLMHGLAIVAVGILLVLRPGRLLRISAWCFLLGVFVSCGSVYLCVLFHRPLLGQIAPIGGVLLIVGWIMLVEGACPGWNKKLAADQDTAVE